MPVSLSSLYNGGGRSGNSNYSNSAAIPSSIENLTTTLFSVPARDAISNVSVSTTRFLREGQYVFLFSPTIQGSFLITSISDAVLSLKNYGGEIIGSGVFPIGTSIVPSGRDGRTIDTIFFSPTQGSVNEQITIHGTGFTGATNAKINDVPLAGFVVVSDSKITGTIPSTTTGKVTVTNSTGTGESLTDFVITVPNIKTVQSSSLLGSGNLGINTFGAVFVASPTAKTITLFTAPYATTINLLRGLRTTAGTCTISIQKNGVNVTGLASIAVTTTPQNPTASALNTLVAGDIVTLVIASPSSAANLSFTMGVTLT